MLTGRLERLRRIGPDTRCSASLSSTQVERDDHQRPGVDNAAVLPALKEVHVKGAKL
jgi:hypothetical protein